MTAFSPFDKTAKYPFDCHPILYEFFIILEKETQIVLVSCIYSLEEQQDLARVKHNLVEC